MIMIDKMNNILSIIRAFLPFTNIPKEIRELFVQRINRQH